jgi:hypothetical protein
MGDNAKIPDILHGLFPSFLRSREGTKKTKARAFVFNLGIWKIGNETGGQLAMISGLLRSDALTAFIKTLAVEER